MTMQIYVTVGMWIYDTMFRKLLHSLLLAVLTQKSERTNCWLIHEYIQQHILSANSLQLLPAECRILDDDNDDDDDNDNDDGNDYNDNGDNDTDDNNNDNNDNDDDDDNADNDDNDDAIQ